MHGRVINWSLYRAIVVGANCCPIDNGNSTYRNYLKTGENVINLICFLYQLMAFNPQAWGAYGDPSDLLPSLAGRTFPLRGGAPRNLQSKIYTVGKLDGNNVGPFSNNGVPGVTSEIATLTSIMVSYTPQTIVTTRPDPSCNALESLRDQAYPLAYNSAWCAAVTCHNTNDPMFLSCGDNGWCYRNQVQYLSVASQISRLAAVCEVTTVQQAAYDAVEYAINFERASQIASYELIARTLRGSSIPNAPLYRDQVLQNQFDQESPLVRNDLLNAANGAGPKELYIEVANEPNLYPYISPAQYAGYYLKWVAYIKGVQKEIAAKGQILTIHFMPGGIGDISGLPLPLQALAKAGTSVSAGLFTELGNIDFVKINTPKYTDQIAYYKAFIAEITKTTDPKSVIDVANLHFYPHSIDNASPQTFAFNQDRWTAIQASYESLLNYAVANSSSGKAIVSEVGSILPYSNGELLSNVAKPMVGWMSSHPSILWWNWYLLKGSDPKLSLLQGVDWGMLYANGAGYAGEYLNMASSIGVYYFGVFPGIHVDYDANALQNSLGYFRDLTNRSKSKGMHQSLLNDDGTLNEVGKWYFGVNFAPIQLLLND